MFQFRTLDQQRTTVQQRTTTVRHLVQRFASLVAIAVSLAACVNSASASSLLIDNFSTPDPSQFYVVGSHNIVTSYQTSSSLGGQRDTLLDVVGTPTPVSLIAVVGHDHVNNMDDLEVATIGNSPGVVLLQYSGVHNFNTGNGTLVNGYALGGAPHTGIDLTNGGVNHFFGFTIGSSDEALGISVTVTSPGPNGTELTSTGIALVQTTSTPSTVTIPFASLVGSASMSNADSVTFAFNSTFAPNIDFTLMQINTMNPVPEPSSYVLSAAGFTALLGLGMKSKRRLAGVLAFEELPPVDVTPQPAAEPRLLSPPGRTS